MDASYFICIGVLVLASASTCFAALKLGIGGSDLTRSHLLLFIACSLSMLGMHFGSDLPIEGSPYLQLPGALFAILPACAIATWFLNRRSERANIISAGIVGLLVLAVAHYLSFPWANRGSEGWVAFAIIITSSALFISLTQNLGGERSSSAIIWWALHSIACVPLLLNLKAVGHIEILFIALTPIAIMGFVSWPLGQALFRLRLALFIGATMCLFLGNAVIRYVPAYDDPAFITWITRLSPLLLLVSAFSLALTQKKNGGMKKLGYAAAAIALISAGALSVFAYTFEGEAEQSSSNDWDYSNF